MLVYILCFFLAIGAFKFLWLCWNNLQKDKH